MRLLRLDGKGPRSQDCWMPRGGSAISRSVDGHHAGSPGARPSAAPGERSIPPRCRGSRATRGSARPLADVPNLVCIGLNYADHARETNSPIPEEPIVFMKHTSSIIGPNDQVRIPRGASKGDWEVELGVVIGTRASYVEEANAMDHVAGYCIVNDVSERDYQRQGGGGQWIKGKSPETFAPIGPWLVTKDEIPDPQNLALWLEVDGRRFQDGSTRTMIFGVGTWSAISAAT